MDDLERVLGRYRLAGPPPEFRERVANAVARERRAEWRAWLAPLAAVLAIVLFYSLAANERAQTGALAAHDAEVRQAMLNEISDALGGDDVARAEAERLIEQNEAAARLELEWPLSAYEVFAYD